MDNTGNGCKALGLAEIGSEDARLRFGELLDRAGFKGERIVITRHGKPVVALVSLEDVTRLEQDAA